MDEMTELLANAELAWRIRAISAESYIEIVRAELDALRREVYTLKRELENAQIARNKAMMERYSHVEETLKQSMKSPPTSVTVDIHGVVDELKHWQGRVESYDKKRVFKMEGF